MNERILLNCTKPPKTQNEGKPKVLGRGRHEQVRAGGTLLQKGSPHKMRGDRKQFGENKLNGSKIKSAILRKANKNKRSE
jgi:hypothetical protein